MRRSRPSTAPRLELLATVGVKVPSPAVREALLGAGCAEGDGLRVCMPAEAVRDALAACPRTFTEAARDPEKDVHVDPDPGPVHVHNSGGAAVVLDLRSGDPRPSTFADQVAATRLMHHLRHQHSVNPLLSPQDVPGPLEPLYSYLALAMRDRQGSSAARASPCRDRSCICSRWPPCCWVGRRRARRGSWGSTSRRSHLLQLGGEVSDALLVAANAGAICRILPAPTAGTTGPAALSAALAQQHAEVLAGVVAVQAILPRHAVHATARACTRPTRAPAPPCGARPRSESAPPAPPCWPGAAGSPATATGWPPTPALVDVQNGYERALNGLLGALARPRYLSGVGGLFSVAAAGLEQIEIDDEILGSILFALEERPWDAEALDAGGAGRRRARRQLPRRPPDADLPAPRGLLLDDLAARSHRRRRCPGGRRSAHARAPRGRTRRPAGRSRDAAVRAHRQRPRALSVWTRGLTPGACSRPHAPSIAASL